MLGESMFGLAAGLSDPTSWHLGNSTNANASSLHRLTEEVEHFDDLMIVTPGSVVCPVGKVAMVLGLF
jgi:hypothetical protein